jgi:hypothetical protein
MWWAAALAAVALAGFIGLAYRRGWQWTGLPAAPATDGGAPVRPARMFWDWLQLLVVPLALAGLAFYLDDQQSGRAQRQEDQRAAQQQQAALDDDREKALGDYLKQMSSLMLDRKLVRSRPSVGAREVAQNDHADDGSAP